MTKSKKHFIDSGDKALGISLAINFLLTIAQIIAGIYSGSVALIADALHNFSDAAGLLIALIARIIGRRPPDLIKTFGYKRVEIIAALINLTTMVLMGVYLIIEAIERYYSPHHINGKIVIITAVISLIINTATAFLVYSISKVSVNIRAAFLHNLSDALGSLAVLVAGILILFYGLNIADIIITLIIAGYIIYQGVKDFPKVIDILVEATPKGLNLEDLIKKLEKIDGVINIHHLHVWQIDEVNIALEAHVVIENLEEMEKIKLKLKKILKEKYEVGHSTLEFEKNVEGCEKYNC